MAKQPQQLQRITRIRHRRKYVRTWRKTRGIALFAALLLGVLLLVHALYRGPASMAEVTAVMPGVPIFPLTQVAPGNSTGQRALAIPLWFMRYQGAKDAEAAQLMAPADDYFIADWYQRLAPTSGWKYIGREDTANGTRLIFIRDHDGLQVLVGYTKDIWTPFQLIYLQGMTNRQVAQLANSVPVEPVAATKPPLTAPAPIPSGNSTPAQSSSPAPALSMLPPAGQTPGVMALPSAPPTTPRMQPTPASPSPAPPSATGGTPGLPDSTSAQQSNTIAAGVASNHSVHKSHHRRQRTPYIAPRIAQATTLPSRASRAVAHATTRAPAHTTPRLAPLAFSKPSITKAGSGRYAAPTPAPTPAPAPSPPPSDTSDTP